MLVVGWCNPLRTAQNHSEPNLCGMWSKTCTCPGIGSTLRSRSGSGGNHGNSLVCMLYLIHIHDDDEYDVAKMSFHFIRDGAYVRM